MENVKKPVPDVEALRYKGSPEKPDIKIFVSHRIDQDSETIDNPLYIPVRCGAVYDERENIAMLGDDTGDNISEKQLCFNELTIQYWAWKNLKADYYGIYEMGRYLFFPNWGEIDNDIRRSAIIKLSKPSSKDIKKYRLKETENIRLEAQKDTGFCAKQIVLYKETVTEVYKQDTYFWDCICICRKVIDELFPNMSPFVEKYLMGNRLSDSYTFIMESTLFMKFSSFVFSTLFEVEKRIDITKLTIEKENVFKRLGKFLLGVFFLMEKTQKHNVVEKYVIEMEEANHEQELRPAFDENNVVVILSSSDFFAPYLGVCIQSIVDTASEKFNYDIIVIEREITKENKKRINMLLENCNGNISIRFYNVTDKMKGLNFYVNSKRLSQETYYGLLMPWILPRYHRAIIMDCDMIVKKDVSRLYFEELNQSIVGGVNDIVLRGWLNDTTNDTYEYYIKDLKILDPFKCFNGGLILLDFDKYKQEVRQEDVLDYINNYKLRVVDQDIFNILLEGKAKLLDVRWNHMVYLEGAISDAIHNAPAAGNRAYFDSQKSPYIIHFASENKPWINPNVEFANEFWLCARKTPFYEIILQRMISDNIGIAVQPALTNTLDTRSGARKVADVLLPHGSKKRKFAKLILPKGSLRWRFCKRIYFIFKPQYRH